MTANVNKCAVGVCNANKVNPVSFGWKWGVDELPIAGQYTYHTLAERSQKTAAGTHAYQKVIGKGKAHIGIRDAIPTDSGLDSRIRICILMNVIVPKLEYAGEVSEGNAKFVKPMETVQMTAAKKK